MITPQLFLIEACKTSRINFSRLEGRQIALLGLLGEFGSVSTVIKKKLRDEEAYLNYKQDLKEEIGDLLWYILVISSHYGVCISDWPKATYSGAMATPQLVIVLNELINDFVVVLNNSTEHEIDTAELYICLIKVIDTLDLLAKTISVNLQDCAQGCYIKTSQYWVDFSSELPARHFDRKFPDYEQLPRKFEITFRSVENSKAAIMYFNDVIIGDKLTDNKAYSDGYRYHDIFHICFAAMLGWSPVLRKLLHCKRKSNSLIDEVQDGARAAIVEEAIINQIFDYGRPNNLEGIKRIDLNLIRKIQNIVNGLEVEVCEAWEWENCILKSFELFRALILQDGGVVEVDAETRAIKIV